MAAMLVYMRDGLQEQGAYRAAGGENNDVFVLARPPGRAGGTDESR